MSEEHYPTGRFGGDMDRAELLVNDLMTGQDVKSFQPTSHLMRIAAKIARDENADTKVWFR